MNFAAIRMCGIPLTVFSVGADRAKSMYDIPLNINCCKDPMKFGTVVVIRISSSG